jgi:hypothetical protein
MKKYIITVEADTPPEIMLGQRIAGGVVIELKQDNGLATAAQLASRYNVSAKTIRSKLSGINQGTTGKALYDLHRAEEIMRTVHRRGRKRLN